MKFCINHPCLLNVVNIARNCCATIYHFPLKALLRRPNPRITDVDVSTKGHIHKKEAMDMIKRSIAIMRSAYNVPNRELKYDFRMYSLALVTT